MKKTIDNQIKELKKIIIQMNDMNKINNNFSEDEVKESLKLGKKFNTILKTLLNSEEGIISLIKLMDDDNSVVCFVVARNLYPIFPSKTMKIMKNYLTQVNDKLEKMRVQDVIEGFQSNQKVFMEQFKRLYNVEDLDSLNREKIHKK